MISSAIRIIAAIAILASTNMCLAAKQPPDWVMNPISDTSSHMYGIAEGKSLQSATQSALENVASRLVTSIESEYREHTTASNDTVNTNTDIDVRAQVGNTKIGGYDVDVSKKVGKSYFVRVKVDKQKLLETNETALVTALSDASEYLDPSKTVSVLKLYEKKRKIQKQLAEARQKSLVVQALAGAKYADKYHQKVTRLQQDFNTRIEQMVVYIDASSELIPFARRLVQELSIEDVRATTEKPAFDSPHVKIRGAFTRGERFDQKYVNANTSIDVYDEFGKSLTSRQVIIDGQAFISHESAINSAINKAIKILIRDGVAYSLGLE